MSLKNTKKVIHRLPCLRYILAEAIICRAEGVALTKRWTGTDVKNIPQYDWAGDANDLRTIFVRFSCYRNPVMFLVREFTPNPDLDCTHRIWKDQNGVFHKVPVAPYAFRDANEAAIAYYQYVHAHMFAAMEEFVRNPEYDPVVCKTYEFV